MGQKVNPFGFRLGSFYPWKARWYAGKDGYKKFLLQDVKLRRFLKEKLKFAGLSKIEIERSINTITIILYVSRPGVVIGRGGSGIENLRKLVQEKLNIKQNDPKSIKLDLKIEEIKKPELSAQLVAERIANQLVKRYPHRRAVNQAIDTVIGAGAKGVKIVLAGRIAGADISRTEKYNRGSVPTQTLRANIDYAEVPALTRSGYIGIKVWIFKGEEESS